MPTMLHCLRPPVVIASFIYPFLLLLSLHSSHLNYWWAQVKHRLALSLDGAAKARMELDRGCYSDGEGPGICSMCSEERHHVVDLLIKYGQCVILMAFLALNLELRRCHVN